MNILIVGAGPTGLTAATELFRHGFKPRIIDKKDAPSPLSRAVGINARSLELLEASGAAQALLARGFKLGQADFHNGAKKIGSMYFSQIRHRYNFLLALPQNETEEVLRTTLEGMGGAVEYGCKLTSLTIDNGKASVSINDGAVEPYDLVIAADGVHSAVREAAQIPFEGYDYTERWSIADFESHDWPAAASAYFLPGGHVRFVIKIGEHRYRAVADEPEALKDIPIPFTLDKLNRSDDFIISARQAHTYQKPPVFLAGDAAHVHSPFGGRGMNLGIEDACILANCIATGTLDGYTALRHPVAKRWIALSERFVHTIVSANPVNQFMRRVVMGTFSAFPALQRPLLERASGLKD